MHMVCVIKRVTTSAAVETREQKPNTAAVVHSDTFTVSLILY